jgi:hypothetical protein
VIGDLVMEWFGDHFISKDLARTKLIIGIKLKNGGLWNCKLCGVFKTKSNFR